MYSLSPLSQSRLGIEAVTKLNAALLRITESYADGDSIVLIFDTLERNECLDDLEEFITWLLSQYSDSTMALFIADRFRRSKSYERAYALYESISRSGISSEHSQALYTGIVHCLFALRKIDLAMAYADEAIARYPTNGDYFRIRGDLFSFIGKHVEAIDDLRQAARLLPGSASLLTQLGVALANVSKSERDPSKYIPLELEAVRVLKSALEIDPNRLIAWANLGSMLLAQRSLDEADAALNRALLLNPEYFPALYNKAYILFLRKQYADSMTVLVRAEKIQRDSPDLYLLKGMVFWQLNNPANSKISFIKCLSLAPDNEDARFYLNELKQRGFG